MSVAVLSHFQAVQRRSMRLSPWCRRPAIVHGRRNRTDGCPGRTGAQSRPCGSHARRPRRTLRRGTAPHGGQRPAEHGVLLPRDADRLGADVSRQQGLTVLPAARGSAVHPAARPHSALVGLRTRCHQRAFSGDPAGALAAVVRIDLRGVRRGQMRRGRGRDSLADHVSGDGDHASGREALPAHRRGARSFWDRVLGCGLYGLLGFRQQLLGRMAQSGNFECGHGCCPGATVACGCARSVREALARPVTPTCAGSDGPRRVDGGTGNLRVRSAHRRVPTRRGHSCIRRFLCSSGRCSASAWLASACRCRY